MGGALEGKGGRGTELWGIPKHRTKCEECPGCIRGRNAREHYRQWVRAGQQVACRRHEFADCSRQPSSSGNPCEIGARTLSKCVPHDVILDRKQHQKRVSFACGGPFHRLGADLQTNTHTRVPYSTGTLVSHLRAEADIDSLANGRGLTSNKDRRSNVMDRCYRPW